MAFESHDIRAMKRRDFQSLQVDDEQPATNLCPFKPPLSHNTKPGLVQVRQKQFPRLFAARHGIILDKCDLATVPQHPAQLVQPLRFVNPVIEGIEGNNQVS